MGAQRHRVLVVTGGHPYDKAEFSALWDSQPDIDWTGAKHPLAQDVLSPAGAAGFDALVFHDIPGIRFRKGALSENLTPPLAFRAGFNGLIASGKPMLFLHHAMAGWPAWDRYAEVIGARFFYQPGTYRGTAHPDSAYCPDAAYIARPVATHPVTEGLEDGLTLVDELYDIQLLEPEIIPLLAADYDFSNNFFLSAAAALRGAHETRNATTVFPLVAWARRVGGAPIVVIQPGDSARTFANLGYRRLICNALRWLVSPDAALWAKETPA
jgi:type 1 glutamine amidotransferase